MSLESVPEMGSKVGFSADATPPCRSETNSRCLDHRLQESAPVPRSRPNTLPQSPPDLGPSELLGFYRKMVLLRRFERTAQALYKAGELPGFIHLYVGEEATAVGILAHLRPDDWITSTHRGHGHALTKGVPAKVVMAELAGKATGCCGGRGGTMHLYAPGVGLFGTNGVVAAGIPSAVGLAISAKVRGTDQVAVAFFGDGAVNHGAFHEALNFGGIQQAPVVFVCENNLYATATPLAATTRNANVASKAAAYGIPGVQVDGNDVLAVWQAAREAVGRARAGEGPTLIESLTYRMVGHHEGDPVVGCYRTQEEMDQWADRCPILTFGQWLVESGAATEGELKAVEAEVEEEIHEAVDFARCSPYPDPATATDHTWAQPINPPLPYADPQAQPAKTVVQGWLEAVRDGLAEEMRRDPHIIYFGEGTGQRGGTFAHTKGLYDEFGPQRMIDTPICELGFTGASIGASASGCRAVADLMMGDFLFEAGSQIVLQAAKLRYMSNGQVAVPMVVLAGQGAIKNAGPHHSGSYYPVWAHCPGLIVAVPSTPADAKGLIKTALRAGDPVIFLEHKSLFATKGPVPVGEHFVPFGQARVVRSGSDLSIVSCGLLLHRSLEAAEQLAAQGISCEVIDLRTIVPLDVQTIVASVAKTGRLLVVDEAHAMFGIGAEIAAVVMEHAFDDLDAPVGRLHTEPVSFPFSPPLEDAVTVNVARIVAAARSVLDGRPPIPRRAVGAARAAAPPQPQPAPGRDGHRPVPTPVAKPETRSQPRPAAATGVPLNMPNMDLTITEATVVTWLKKVGDRVRSGEPVLEVETDKAVTPVESPADGTLVEILATEGTVVALGGRLGTIQI
jgi:2-oxoisovalerate dehydrogenase E1 component